MKHDFLSPPVGREVVTISRLVNAFFRWEFNSCETLVKGGEVHPIDYANASPDVALTSLHYYFPWAIKTLVKWSAFCVGHRAAGCAINQNTRDYFAVGDRDDLAYEEKLDEYRKLADDVLPGRGVRGVLREATLGTSTSSRSILRVARVRRAARRHGDGGVPGARARGDGRAAPRARRRLGRRPALGSTVADAGTALDPRDFLAVDALLDDEERAIRDTVRQLRAGARVPNVGEWFEQGILPRELVQEVAPLGLFGMHLEGYGLPGASSVAYRLTCMELEAGDSGVRSLVSVQGSLAMFAIWRWGSEEQKQRWLPPMHAGEALGCSG